MKTFRVHLSVFALLSACATPGDLPLDSAEPRWSQRPEEASLLPVGKVLEVVGTNGAVPPSLAKPGAAGTANQTGAQADLTAFTQASAQKQGRRYRHRVALLSGAIRELEVDYQFAVGDCVALRTVKHQKRTLLQIVEALPGACG
jgi:hypothetical protein